VSCELNLSKISASTTGCDSESDSKRISQIHFSESGDANIEEVRSLIDLFEGWAFQQRRIDESQKILNSERICDEGFDESKSLTNESVLSFSTMLKTEREIANVTGRDRFDIWTKQKSTFLRI
jgi:hypothetical protein